jgi:hypothetical protein
MQQHTSLPLEKGFQKQLVDASSPRRAECDSALMTQVAHKTKIDLSREV